MPASLKSKFPNIGATIFSTMSQLAQKHQAVNLGQGFPDFPVNPELIDRVHHYMQKGYNQYSQLAGVEPLRKVLASLANKEGGYQYNHEDEVNITHGATQAIASAIGCSIREGDEVIIFTPAYDCYAPMVELYGGVPVYVQLQHPYYTVDWDTVKNRINHRTKMIIINTPHNPSATVLSPQDLQKLNEITQGSNILILSDEVYENIVFDQHSHSSVADIPELAERSFKIGSMGKTLHATGWKIGYCMAPAHLMEEFRKVQQFMVFCANTPIQYAMADYLEDINVVNISDMYEHKRNLFLEYASGSAFKPLTSQGTYFQLLDYSEISDEPEEDFAIRLTREYGITAIPISVFYHHPQQNKVLRFCFAKNEETLKKAGDLLRMVSQ